MASGQAIASGAVILTANADSLVNGLQKSQQGVINWGNKTANSAAAATAKIGNEVESGFHKTQSKLDKAFGKFAKKEGGFLGMLGGGVLGDLGLASSAAIIAGLALGLRQVAHWVDDIGGFTKEFNKELERSQKYLTMIEKQLDSSAKLTDEWKAAMIAPSDVLAQIEKQMQDTREAINSVGADFEIMAKQAKAMEEPSLKGFGRFLLGKDEESTKLAIERANAYRTVLDKLVDRFKAAQQEKDRLLDPSKDPAMVSAFQRSMKTMADSIVQLGMKPWEKELMDKFEGRLPDEKIQQFRDVAMAAEKAAEKWKEMEAAAVTTAGRGGLFGLNKILTGTGLVAKELARMANMEPDKFKALTSNEPMKFSPAAIRGGIEDYRLSVQSQFSGMTGTDKTVDAVKQLKSPLDKAVDRLDQINKRLGDWEVV